MRLSGHETRAIFDRYDVGNEQDLQEAAERLELAQSKHKAKLKIVSE